MSRREKREELREVRTASKGDLLGRRGDPVCERRAANLVPESDHAGNRLPTVLAKPAKDDGRSWSESAYISMMIETRAYHPFVPTLPVQVPVPIETVKGQGEFVGQKGGAYRRWELPRRSRRSWCNSRG